MLIVPEKVRNKTVPYMLAYLGFMVPACFSNDLGVAEHSGIATNIYVAVCGSFAYGFCDRCWFHDRTWHRGPFLGCLPSSPRRPPYSNTLL